MDLPLGTKQGAVKFAVQPTARYVSWQVKAGRRICGVQVTAGLDNPTVDSMLLAQVGYTSGVKSGSNAAAGTETIPVRIPTKAIGHRGFEEYEGKTLSILSMRQVTGFVKKA